MIQNWCCDFEKVIYNFFEERRNLEAIHKMEYKVFAQIEYLLYPSSIYLFNLSLL